MKTLKVLGVDPGTNGAFVLFDGAAFVTAAMPITISGKEKLVDFLGVQSLLAALKKNHGLFHVFLERAVPMAMGSKGAFTYGRGFEALVIALGLAGNPVTHIEPSKWTKEMHEGISADLKPKARSLIAVKRLYPQLVGSLPKRPKGGLHDGPIDALLIAGYGLRRLQGQKPVNADEVGDFF